MFAAIPHGVHALDALAYPHEFCNPRRKSRDALVDEINSSREHIPVAARRWDRKWTIYARRIAYSAAWKRKLAARL